MRDKVLILGIGNYLMGDEGVGVHLARSLQQLPLPLPEGVEVVDGGTGGFHLLDYFDQYDTVIMVDAALDEQPVGTMRTIRPKFASDFPRAMSTHDIGMKDLVNVLQLLGKMTDIWLITVSIESLQQQGIELTDPIAAVMPALIKRVDKLAHSFLRTEVAL
jgi:hydrogenase maturation protease